MLPRRHILTRAIGRLASARLTLEWIARSELAYGERELALLPFLADSSRASVDIGAAQGIYTYWLSKVSRNVVAVEPNPDSFRFLTRAFRSFDNVALLNCAVSDAEGSAVLRVPLIATDHNRKALQLEGWGTIDSRNEFSDLACIGTREYAVRAVLPAAFIPDNVGLIKIDVEGLEHRILRCLPAAVWRARPSILVEVGESMRGQDDLAHVHDLLSSKDYEVFSLSGRGLRSVSRSFKPTVTPNLIALPNDRL
jgi:FkbM family methyltransferase